MNTTERRGRAAVSWLKNTKSNRKPYEDRYRLLSADISLVRSSGRGELFAVLDGIGGMPMGMQASQAMAECLINFYRKPEEIPADSNGLMDLLLRANQAINDWGCVEVSDCPLGGAAGTIAWLHGRELTLFHVGDTAGILIRQDQPSRVLTGLHESYGGITRYFGQGRRLEVEIQTERLEEGDLILLISDGVTKAYSTTEAADIVREIFGKTGDAGRAAEELVTRSRNRGSRDDITALVIEISEDDEL